jgi:hypothetical protein
LYQGRLLLDATLLSFYAYAVHIGSGSVLPVIVGYIFATSIAALLFILAFTLVLANTSMSTYSELASIAESTVV